MKKITLKYNIFVEDEENYNEILDAMEDNVHNIRDLGAAYLDAEMEEIILSVEKHDEEED
jgi:hypothetical protein